MTAGTWGAPLLGASAKPPGTLIAFTSQLYSGDAKVGADTADMTPSAYKSETIHSVRWDDPNEGATAAIEILMDTSALGSTFITGLTINGLDRPTLSTYDPNYTIANYSRYVFTGTGNINIDDGVSVEMYLRDT